MAKRAVKVNGTRVSDPEHQTLIRATARHFAKDERKEKRNKRVSSYMKTGK